MQQESIESVLKKHNGRLLATPGIVGTAIGKYRRKLCITIFVHMNDTEIQQHLPATLDGYPVRIEETGEFQALDQK